MKLISKFDSFIPISQAETDINHHVMKKKNFKKNRDVTDGRDDSLRPKKISRKEKNAFLLSEEELNEDLEDWEEIRNYNQYDEDEDEDDFYDEDDDWSDDSIIPNHSNQLKIYRGEATLLFFMLFGVPKMPKSIQLCSGIICFIN